MFIRYLIITFNCRTIRAAARRFTREQSALFRRLYSKLVNDVIEDLKLGELEGVDPGTPYSAEVEGAAISAGVAFDGFQVSIFVIGVDWEGTGTRPRFVGPDTLHNEGFRSATLWRLGHDGLDWVQGMIAGDAIHGMDQIAPPLAPRRVMRILVAEQVIEASRRWGRLQNQIFRCLRLRLRRRIEADLAGGRFEQGPRCRRLSVALRRSRMVADVIVRPEEIAVHILGIDFGGGDDASPGRGQDALGFETFGPWMPPRRRRLGQSRPRSRGFGSSIAVRAAHVERGESFFVSNGRIGAYSELRILRRFILRGGGTGIGRTHQSSPDRRPIIGPTIFCGEESNKKVSPMGGHAVFISYRRDDTVATEIARALASSFFGTWLDPLFDGDRAGAGFEVQAHRIADEIRDASAKTSTAVAVIESDVRAPDHVWDDDDASSENLFSSIELSSIRPLSIECDSLKCRRSGSLWFDTASRIALFSILHGDAPSWKFRLDRLQPAWSSKDLNIADEQDGNLLREMDAAIASLDSLRIGCGRQAGKSADLCVDASTSRAAAPSGQVPEKRKSDCIASKIMTSEQKTEPMNDRTSKAEFVSEACEGSGRSTGGSKTQIDIGTKFGVPPQSRNILQSSALLHRGLENVSAVQMLHSSASMASPGVVQCFADGLDLPATAAQSLLACEQQRPFAHFESCGLEF